jgi:hypothetical protein
MGRDFGMDLDGLGWIGWIGMDLDGFGWFEMV